eukprot:m.121069 g.121069  ORF g.121069 m.121069 type:complete len:194 (-) comp19609_c1_seq1:633-1214(-)
MTSEELQQALQAFAFLEPLVEHEASVVRLPSDVRIVLLEAASASGRLGVLLEGDVGRGLRLQWVQPALQPAVQPGDRILAVNGHSVWGLEHAQVASLLRAALPHVALLLFWYRSREHLDAPAAEPPASRAANGADWPVASGHWLARQRRRQRRRRPSLFDAIVHMLHRALTDSACTFAHYPFCSGKKFRVVLS